jgi:hypothetical protein
MLELHLPRDLHPNCSLPLNSHPPVRNTALPIWPRIGRDHSSLQETHPMEGPPSLLESSLRHPRD